MRLLICACMLTALALTTSGSAHAQTSTSTTVVSKRPGDVVINDACEFRAQVPVTLSVNGQAVTVINSDVDGCVTTPVNVLSCQPPHVAIRQTRAAARVGKNTVAYAGVGRDGKSIVKTIDFRLRCPKPGKPFNWTPVFAVGGGAVGIVLIGVLAAARNRRNAEFF